MADDVVGRDFLLEFATRDRSKRLVVGCDGEGVLVFAADLPFFRDFFRGDAHAVGNRHVLVAVGENLR